MAKLTFVDYIENALKKNQGKAFCANDLANLIANIYPEYFEKRMHNEGKNKKEQIEQIKREIYSVNARGRFSDNISVTTDSPKKFSYLETSSPAKHKNNQEEQSLYALLCAYLADGLNLYSKRINEKRSSNKSKNGNIFLYPDVVGVRVLSENYCDRMQKFIKHYKADQIELYSFEVKCELTGPSVRKDFLQTVSNSGWANYTYLVAPKIDDNAMRELQILCSAYNVGLIKLNKENPAESQIVIPVKGKEKLDLNIMNRICEANTDFAAVLSYIETFYATSIEQLRKQEWTNMPVDDKEIA